jgi:predicted AAA+ superfamily ATPase
METVERFLKDSGQNFFLFGPRGTGKSTWLKQQMPEALYIDLLEPDVYRSYSARPERLEEVSGATEKGATIVVDEVQKIPQLLDVVHRLLEMKTGQRFILTGSSARKLKRSGTDLLAGRAVVKTLHPFMASELGSAFSLDDALIFGMLPLVMDSPNPDETLKAYASFYLREEVQMEGIVRNIGAFNRFMESISFSHGSVLNISEVARDCQVERKTVEGYVSVLEDLLISFRIPVFKKRAKRHLISHQKFFYFDAGVFRSLRPSGPLDSPHEIDGAALEGLVCQHLIAWNALSGDNNKLYFWRTKSGNEVDFIVYGKDTFCAVEVKNTARFSKKMLKSLRAFKEDYPESHGYLLYRGKERLKINDVLCLPCEEFLLKLVPNMPIGA